MDNRKKTETVNRHRQSTRFVGKNPNRVERKRSMNETEVQKDSRPLFEKYPNVVENRQLNFDCESNMVEFLTMKLLTACIMGHDIKTKLQLHSQLERYLDSAPPDKQEEMRHESVELAENFIAHCKDYCKRFNHTTFGIIEIKELKRW